MGELDIIEATYALLICFYIKDYHTVAGSNAFKRKYTVFTEDSHIRAIIEAGGGEGLLELARNFEIGCNCSLPENSVQIFCIGKNERGVHLGITINLPEDN